MAMHLLLHCHEAIMNTGRHSAARAVTVALVRRANQLVMRVEDDETGLAERAERTEGLGMHTMRYRTDLIGGLLTFSATDEEKASRDTCVRVTVPIALARGSSNGTAAVS